MLNISILLIFLVSVTEEGEQQRESENINNRDDENCSQIIKSPTSIILGTSSHKKDKEDFPSETSHPKVSFAIQGK